MSEYSEWLQSPITRGVLKALEQLRDTYRGQMGTGLTLNIDNPFATQALTAKIIGKQEGIQEAIDFIRSSDV